MSAYYELVVYLSLCEISLFLNFIDDFCQMGYLSIFLFDHHIEGLSLVVVGSTAYSFVVDGHTLIRFFGNFFILVCEKSLQLLFVELDQELKVVDLLTQLLIFEM